MARRAAVFGCRVIAANRSPREPGDGVERIFPLHSPVIDKIEVTRPGRVRRAKLYYLRERSAKSARIREKLSKRVVEETVAEAAAAE